MMKPKRTLQAWDHGKYKNLWPCIVCTLYFFFLPADAKSTFALNSREGRGWLAKGEVRTSTDLCPCSEVWQCCWRPSSHSVFLWQPLQSSPEGGPCWSDLECGFIALMLTQMVYKGKFWTSFTCYCFLRCLGSQSMGADHLSSPNQKKYLKSSLGNKNVRGLEVESGTLLHLNNPIWNGIGRSQHPLGHTDILHYASEMHGRA